MVEAILTELSKSSFDFRNFANPSDPLSGLFEEWIPYYRLKFCIAKVLQPKSILEVGVRYGYSARSFLEASPSASFSAVFIFSAVKTDSTATASGEYSATSAAIRR